MVILVLGNVLSHSLTHNRPHSPPHTLVHTTDTPMDTKAFTKPRTKDHRHTVYTLAAPLGNHAFHQHIRLHQTYDAHKNTIITHHTHFITRQNMFHAPQKSHHASQFVVTRLTEDKLSCASKIVSGMYHSQHCVRGSTN